MKCPICGQELRPSKKDPNYFLCYECKKKFKVPQKKTEKPEKAEKKVRRHRQKKNSLIPIYRQNMCGKTGD